MGSSKNFTGLITLLSPLNTKAKLATICCVRLRAQNIDASSLTIGPNAHAYLIRKIVIMTIITVMLY